MTIQKTNKTFLTNEDILLYISNYEAQVVPHLNDLWEYYKGKNVKISKRQAPDPNNPDNKVIISYGRKLVTTYTGYGYRPKYITYKPNIKKTNEQIDDDEQNIFQKALGKIKQVLKIEPIEKKLCNEIQYIYNANNEHIKANRAGRNLGWAGFSYELLYIDSEYQLTNGNINTLATPKFITVDPREMIVLYDYSVEPKIVIAIRYYKMSDNEYKVEVYYKDKMIPYIRYRNEANATQWLLKADGNETINFYSEVPVVAFYRGDEIQSIIENVLTSIDAYDILMSDSLNEFDRFAFAYLVMKGISLTSPQDKKDPTKGNQSLKEIKRRRVFEGLSKDASIEFLTKNIPTEFIQYMADKLKMEIHLQSHVPDFTMLTGALSGAAIDRLLFDFENLVSSDEADFDVALIKRGKLITELLVKLNRIPNNSDFATMINISHKRNLPLDRNSFAQLALNMSSAGFSRRRILENMPEDMVPDVEAELEEEKEEQEALMLNSLEEPIEEPVDEETNLEEGA